MPLQTNHIEDVLSTVSGEINSPISSILKLNVLNPENEKVIISDINKKINIAKTRRQGLQYLNLIISGCSAEVLAENALAWINQCSIKYKDDNLRELKLVTIANIVESVTGDQDFTKKFVSDHISKVLEYCLSSENSTSEISAALDLLTILLRQYPSTFNPHKVKIENFLIPFLDNPLEDLVQRAALAFHWLQQVGGAGSDGINHINNFANQFQKLCRTVHTVLDEFFKDVPVFDNPTYIEGPTFEFKSVSVISQELYYVLERRLKNCLTFISTMMRTRYTAPKEIVASDILSIISRGTSLHVCLSEENVSLDSCHFSLLVNNLQLELLKLLRLFMVMFQSNSLPFSYNISKILVDCMNRSQSCDCFKSDSLYQESVYKTLSYWSRISRCSIHAHFQNQMVQSVLKDITPSKNQLTLTIQDVNTKHKSSKAKKKAIQERIINSGDVNKNTSAPSKHAKVAKENICKMALAALKQLLTATTLNVNNTVLQEMYNVVINNLIEIQSNKIVLPYTSTDCQKGLYEVVVAFYEQCNQKILPPLQLTLHILNIGVNHYNRHISLICENGLNMLEKLCQPICPSLYMGAVNISNALDEKVEDKMDVLKSEKSYASETETFVNLNSPLSESSVNVIESNELEYSIENSPNFPKSTDKVNILSMQIIRSSDNLIGETELNPTENLIVNEQESNEIVNELSPLIIEEDVIDIENREVSSVDDDVLHEEIIDVDVGNDSISIKDEFEEPPSKKFKDDEDDVISIMDDFVDEIKDGLIL